MLTALIILTIVDNSSAAFIIVIHISNALF
ncbi:unnamed protein product, partial [Rotaria socialis]